MQNLKNILEKWEKLVDKYDKDSTKLQKKISEILKLEWTTNNSRSETDLKKFIDRSGQWWDTYLFINFIIEKFSTKVESKILRSVFALDTLMCQIENDLEDMNPTKKRREESSSESESHEVSENSETSSDSD